MIILTRLAYRRVLTDLSRLLSAGEMAATIAVLALPPSDVLSSRVSTESRYGMWSLPADSQEGVRERGGPEDWEALSSLNVAVPLCDTLPPRLIEDDVPPSASLEMTVPRVRRDLLMALPSLSSRSASTPPGAARALSDPAKSTRYRLAERTGFFVPQLARGLHTPLIVSPVAEQAGRRG